MLRSSLQFTVTVGCASIPLHNGRKSLRGDSAVVSGGSWGQSPEFLLRLIEEFPHRPRSGEIPREKEWGFSYPHSHGGTESPPSYPPNSDPTGARRRQRRRRGGQECPPRGCSMFFSEGEQMFDRATEDLRELPAYTVSEVAHYLTVPPATIRYWSVGRGSCEPLITLPENSPSRPTLLSFYNLVELHVLAAVRREYRITMPKVRTAIR